MPDDHAMSSIFLSKASPYGRAVEPVEIIQTHVSLVLLAGDCAYKLKRAIQFPPRTFLPLSSGGRPARPSSRSTPEWRLNFISMSER